MSTRPCRRLPAAKLAADNAGELESTQLSLHVPETSESCVNTIPQVILTSPYPLAWQPAPEAHLVLPEELQTTEHKLFSSWLTLSPVPLKLLLPSPIALYCTIITFTSFAFFPFPSVASPSSTSLNLSFNSESVAITKLHDFVNETQVTLEGWVTIEFLTHIGQTCTPLHQEFILLSNVLGVPVLALVNALNNPPVSTGMESSILEPFFKSSEGKGEYLYVEGHMHTTSSVPIPGAVIKMWETDDKDAVVTWVPSWMKPVVVRVLGKDCGMGPIRACRIPIGVQCLFYGDIRWGTGDFADILPVEVVDYIVTVGWASGARVEVFED
ncbi:hypothetical protein EDB87DRAFT_1687900 [Lactarius vividus]|nr:hypothetical protein EDB87DRAFT_1687900 [Lactarius vividus]